MWLVWYNGGYPDIRRVINSAQSQIVDGKLVNRSE